MALTATAVKALKPRDRIYKRADEKGLYIQVRTDGAKYWRVKYTLHGREKLLSVGVYPEVTLAMAREQRDDIRRQLAAGRDPSEERKAARNKAQSASANSFEAVALRWFKEHGEHLSASYAPKVNARLKRYLFPAIGRRPIGEIGAKDLAPILKAIEDDGKRTTAHRVRTICGQVFRYAVIHGLAAHNPVPDLQGFLKRAKSRSFASITKPAEVGGLLRAIDGYTGEYETKAALQLMALVFVRNRELRLAEWSEFDFGAAEWRIPEDRMKLRRPHIVPLSRQAIEILEGLFVRTGVDGARYLFPSARTRSRPVSENAWIAALRRMGYAKGEMTIHGFRSMASTLLNSQAYNRDVIERQLAHGEQDKVRGAYNFADYMPQRQRMMQEWADYLDELRENVAPLLPGERRSVGSRDEPMEGGIVGAGESHDRALRH